MYWKGPAFPEKEGHFWKWQTRWFPSRKDSSHTLTQGKAWLKGRQVWEKKKNYILWRNDKIENPWRRGKLKIPIKKLNVLFVYHNLTTFLTIVTLQHAVDNRSGCIVVNIHLFCVNTEHSVVGELFWWLPSASARVFHGDDSSTFFHINSQTTSACNFFFVHGTASYNNTNIIGVRVYLCFKLKTEKR